MSCHYEIQANWINPWYQPFTCVNKHREITRANSWSLSQPDSSRGNRDRKEKCVNVSVWGRLCRQMSCLTVNYPFLADSKWGKGILKEWMLNASRQNSTRTLLCSMSNFTRDLSESIEKCCHPGFVYILERYWAHSAIGSGPSFFSGICQTRGLPQHCFCHHCRHKALNGRSWQPVGLKWTWWDSLRQSKPSASDRWVWSDMCLMNQIIISCTSPTL